MNFTEIGRMIEALSKERGINKNIVTGAIEQAFLVTARKKYGIQGEYETKYNEAEGDIEIYQYKTVVETVRDHVIEVDTEQASKLDPGCELGDQLGIKVETPEFTRVDVQTVKQIIFQKVRDAEREILFAEFKHRVGEIITGIARRYERGNVLVDLGKADAVLPRREIIPGENYKPGDRIQAFLSEVVMTTKGPEIRLTRTSPKFLVKLFEMEVPEIHDGTIEIKVAAREPGYRAKVAVYTRDRDIDPVGACVGMKGSRVQNIVNELQGEKIDIVRWNEDSDVFTRSALAPAEITSIRQGEDGVVDVVVEEDQLSLAIGRRGQNVRLAAMLTGRKINIVSKTKLQEKIKKAVENLVQMPEVGDTQAQMFVQNGIMSISDLSLATCDELRRILGLKDEDGQKILEAARKAVADAVIPVVPELAEEIISASAIPGENVYHTAGQGPALKEGELKGKYSEVEKRLREELAVLKIK